MIFWFIGIHKYHPSGTKKIISVIICHPIGSFFDPNDFQNILFCVQQKKENDMEGYEGK